jgi:hypothetical protein
MPEIFSRKPRSHGSTWAVQNLRLPTWKDHPIFVIHEFQPINTLSDEDIISILSFKEFFLKKNKITYLFCRCELNELEELKDR